MNSDETRKAFGTVNAEDIASYRWHLMSAVESLDKAYIALSHGSGDDAQAMCDVAGEASTPLRAMLRRIDNEEV